MMATHALAHASTKIAMTSTTRSVVRACARALRSRDNGQKPPSHVSRSDLFSRVRHALSLPTGVDGVLAMLRESAPAAPAPAPILVRVFGS